MERCPNCRARYQDGDDCRRCGMDLSQLLAAERAADALVRQALAQLAAGDARAAAGSLGRADTLRRDPFLDLLRSFARTLAREQSTCPEPLPAARAETTPVAAAERSSRLAEIGPARGGDHEPL